MPRLSLEYFSGRRKSVVSNVLLLCWFFAGLNKTFLGLIDCCSQMPSKTDRYCLYFLKITGKLLSLSYLFIAGTKTIFAGSSCNDLITSDVSG